MASRSLSEARTPFGSVTSATLPLARPRAVGVRQAVTAAAEVTCYQAAPHKICWRGQLSVDTCGWGVRRASSPDSSGTSSEGHGDAATQRRPAMQPEAFLLHHLANSAGSVSDLSTRPRDASRTHHTCSTHLFRDPFITALSHRRTDADGRIYPSIPPQVLEDGVWKQGLADFRQRRPDGWYFHVLLYHPPMFSRLLWARHPDQIRQREEPTLLRVRPSHGSIVEMASDDGLSRRAHPGSAVTPPTSEAVRTRQCRGRVVQGEQRGFCSGPVFP